MEFGGSSPLTRGKRADSHDSQADGGLIPAHAGKTARELNPALYSPAHPRSRGENYQLPRQGSNLQGSSPLTRGKLSPGEATNAYKGLIPAHAGKTT